MKPFYVTSPIFYPNAQPHLGHAYATLLCDVVSRQHKLSGEETYFLTGTDEHTEKVIKAAEASGEPADKYLEDIVARFKELYSELNISYDQFIRTSDRNFHWPGALEMWKRLDEAGTLTLQEYTGLYCLGCESFKTEKDLKDGKCPDHGTVPEKVSEKNWFFKLSEFGSELKNLIENDTIRIIPSSRKKEILTFINTELKDVSFSRPKEKMTWGIPVPNDPTQTMYIWVDALSSYITALGFGRGEENMRFWPGTHVIGKDIIRFHAVFWPAMLLAAKLPLPETIFVHGTIISDGKKMSKTLGNVIDPRDLIKKYGTDATRYLLLRHVHPTEDSDITWERLDEWYTAHLVNGLGNLVSRVMKLSESYDVKTVFTQHKTEPHIVDAINRFAFGEALDAVWQKIQRADARMTEEEPFKVIKTDIQKGKESIQFLVQDLHRISEELKPFMPETAEKIKQAVKENKKPENLFPRIDSK